MGFKLELKLQPKISVVATQIPRLESDLAVSSIGNFTHGIGIDGMVPMTTLLPIRNMNFID